MIDVSDSMFTRTGDAQYPSKLVRHGKEQNFQIVRDEAIKLVQSLTPATRFGIVRWSGGAYSWKPELVQATEENKTAAIAHIQNEVDFKTARPKGGRQRATAASSARSKPRIAAKARKRRSNKLQRVVIPSEAKRSRGIPGSYLKTCATGSLGFARDDRKGSAATVPSCAKSISPIS